jgi:hypothetical protein
MSKIALFTIAVGKDSVYFDSVRRYLPYNRQHFDQGCDVDYILFTDRSEAIEGVISVPCGSSVWPYTTLLKNNLISDYLSAAGGWQRYDRIFFIDADFAIGSEHDFFEYDFLLVKPYWNSKNGGGFFYGGKSDFFRQLCAAYYEEVKLIYDSKLPVPRDLDEFYLGLFREQRQGDIHIVEMDKSTNTLTFFDNEDLEEKIRQQGKKLFIQPYKADGRANRTIVLDADNRPRECIVNLNEGYIFDNYSYDFGRLLKIDALYYRILWSKQPELREVLNTETNAIIRKL